MNTEHDHPSQTKTAKSHVQYSCTGQVRQRAKTGLPVPEIGWASGARIMAERMADGVAVGGPGRILRSTKLQYVGLKGRNPYSGLPIGQSPARCGGLEPSVYRGART